jgi:hypothetical protein
MSRLRFSTARDVFDAFPTASEDIRARATDDAPIAYVKALARGTTPEDALTFCAYVLPRREAVWWACQCLRSLIAAPSAAEAALVQSAEAWVREPEDSIRRAALAAGEAASRNSPATWAALAAGWSGGSMVEGHSVPCPPHLTAKAVRIAVLSALARLDTGQRAAAISGCVDRALRLTEEPRAGAK